MHPPSDHAEWIARARDQAERANAGTGSSAIRLGAPDAPSADAGPTLSGYTIRRQIHRGGQGVVYEAMQHSTSRTVALKFLREGPFAGERDRHRFDREVSILARLNHRHIVRIIDRSAAAGSEFLVMDYVDGVPLDRYVREHDPPLRERLNLFILICDAVTAAHLRGVIHRDLKPGNILIDPAGEPHVLDFGLAKSDAKNITEADTQTGVFIGSLPWASPEQAAGRHADVDVRSDVYSLGVILYHLLTGRLPYSTVGPLEQILRNIRSEMPIRPRAIAATIDEDLEVIVLKSLNKEPARRYQSVGELVRDVRHYLADEPIEARRDSGWYMLRKLLNRHRASAMIAASFVLLVAIAGIVALALWRNASSERDRAIAARQLANLEAAKAMRITQFAQEMLSGIDPATAGEMDTRLMRHVLDNAAKRVDAELGEAPEAQAAVRRSIGKAYQAIGEFSLAQEQMERAVEVSRRSGGGDGAEWLKAMDDLALIYWENGRSADAEAMSRAVLDARRQLLGPDHPATLLTMAILTEALHSQGRLEQAEALARETLERRTRVLGPEDVETLSSMNNLAGILNSARRFNEAEPLYKKAIEAEQRVKGIQHPDTLRTRNNLSALYHQSGRIAEAEPLLRENIELMKRVLGEGHPDTLLALGNLASLLRLKGEYDQAEETLRNLIAAERRVIGPGNPAIAGHLLSLASLVSRRGDHAAAETLLREAIKINEAALPESHPQRLTTELALGVCLARMNRLEESERLLVSGLAAIEGRPEIHINWRITSIKVLVDLYAAWDSLEPGTGKAEQAAEWRQRLEALHASTQASPTR